MMRCGRHGLTEASRRAQYAELVTADRVDSGLLSGLQRSLKQDSDRPAMAALVAKLGTDAVTLE